MARAGSVRTLPALLISRLWFNSRMSSCQVDGPGAIPGSRTNSYRLRVSTRPSLQNSAYSGRHGGSLPFSFGVVADKQCTCPASKLMWERYPPTPPAFARCGAAGEGCRAVARRAEAGITSPKAPGFGSAGQFQLRETRPMHGEKPHKLLQVGVTRTPATTFSGK